VPRPDSDKFEEARATDRLLPYISKSRLTQFVKCPEKFRFVYIDGLREPENVYMRRGSAVHLAFEKFYDAAADLIEREGRPPRPNEFVDLLPETLLWGPHLDPYISEFLVFERRRLDAARVAVSKMDVPDDEREVTVARLWLPIEVEREVWIDDPLGIAGHGDIEPVPAMGFADAVYYAGSLPEYAHADPETAVVCDFKTGKVPFEQYREDGIYLELEYYAFLFEGEYDFAGVAAFYPLTGELLTAPLSADRRARVLDVIRQLTEINDTRPTQLSIKTGPLCYGTWGHCAHYDRCRSTWGEPFVHEERFRAMAEGGYSDEEIADDLGTTLDAVRYAKRKFGL
jgi:RecB family exonuclease